MAQPLLTATPPTDARGRLLEGLAASIVHKGYAATTIADVVREARVSKRTFYEHFADKEACYLAVYQAASERMLGVLAEAATSQDLPWDRRLEAAAHAYLSELAAQPALTRTFLMEIQAAGPRALAMRRQVLGRFAALLRSLTQEAAAREPGLTPLSPAMATAIVGGINELMLEAVEQERTQRLAELAGTAAQLVRSALTASAAPRDG